MREINLCCYAYDPLDQLVGTSTQTDAKTQRFYCKRRLTSEIGERLKYSIFQHDNHLLAEQQFDETTANTRLLATDQQRSVMHTVSSQPTRHVAYSPYGHRPPGSGLLSLLEFNGERRDPATGFYLSGIGYRGFNPVLMRFNSPDSWSPFGKGGLNPYAYCLGDPVNRRDPNGHFSFWSRFIRLVDEMPGPARNVTSRLPTPTTPRPRIASNPISATIGVSETAQEPINFAFNYRPLRENPRIEHRTGMTGSLDSIAASHSTSSLDSASSLGSRRSFGSSISLSSSGSNSSTATASSRSTRGSVSTDSDWSGSGRRIDSEWGSNESMIPVSSYSSGSAPRVTFEDTLLTLGPQGNVVYVRDFIPQRASRIRRLSNP
ncbi:RHS repeat-associated core domain protein-containing protein [Pseudomonas sp. GM55]|nr:RHS repeat-associated core domain protein-containing protein [Pseudomonas sp. GM55]